MVDGLGRVHAIDEARVHTVWVGRWYCREMMRHVRTSHGGIVCDARVRIKPLVGNITRTTYNGAAHFVKECASKHSSSGCSLFAYFNPYTDVSCREDHPTTIPPRTNWFWCKAFRTVITPYCLGDNHRLYAFSLPHYHVLVNSLYFLHTHESAPPHAHIGWHDHASLTKFQWTFLAFPLSRADRVFAELSTFCIEYKKRTGYVNAYFVSYVMEKDAHATFSYASDGPVVTIDPIAANSCKRFLPFCEALVEHLEATVGGLSAPSIELACRLGRWAVRAN